MKHTNTVFHDLLQQISKPLFDKTVKRHQGDHRVRTLRCWTQFVALLYGQLTQRQSLRDLELAFNSHANHHYHLGTQRISRSTLIIVTKAELLNSFYSIITGFKLKHEDYLLIACRLLLSKVLIKFIKLLLAASKLCFHDGFSRKVYITTVSLTLGFVNLV